jgi:hypothetical protein
MPSRKRQPRRYGTDNQEKGSLTREEFLDSRHGDAAPTLDQPPSARRARSRRSAKSPASACRAGSSAGSSVPCPFGRYGRRAAIAKPNATARTSKQRRKIHEIKHDGFRILARREAERVARHLLDEQRHAAGPLGDAIDDLVRQRVAG